MEWNKKEPIPILLEHARSFDEIRWGLMNRKQLPKDHGMLFHHGRNQRVSLWSFNCYLDLSIGFLDENGIIREIGTLYAFPDQMDPSRPVKNLADLRQYPYDDPIRTFFLSKSIVSSYPVRYSLEMLGGWLQENGIKEGDVLIWEDTTSQASIVRTLDISYSLPSEDQPILFRQTKEKLLSLWLLNDSKGRDIAFLDKEHRVMQISHLEGGKDYSVETCPVICSKKPAAYALIALPGWLKKHHIQTSDKISLNN